jgi:hypothetical protein
MIGKINDDLILQLLNVGRLIVNQTTGQVFASKSNNPDKPLGTKTPKGYLRTAVSVDGKRISLMMHRVVCIAVYGLPPYAEAQVNHSNGIKSDNCPTNISWSTQPENMQHAKKHGLLKPVKQERHYNARLSKVQVEEIRASRDSSKELSETYHVSRTQIRRIITAKRWTQNVQDRSDNPYHKYSGHLLDGKEWRGFPK